MILARSLGVCFLVILAGTASGQESYKVEALKAAAPDGIAGAVRESLSDDAVRVLDAEGKPFAEIWVRKDLESKSKPAGTAGTVQFPVLSEGELLGAVRFVGEGHDYRDQAIAPGLYTIRYGLQPVNGDHLGVSLYRDYALLVPAAKDQKLARLERKTLETQSAEAAGSSHPAVMLLLSAPADTKETPSIARDEEKNLWSVVLNVPLTVKDEKAPVPLPLQLVISGAAM